MGLVSDRGAQSNQPHGDLVEVQRGFIFSRPFSRGFSSLFSPIFFLSFVDCSSGATANSLSDSLAVC